MICQQFVYILVRLPVADQATKLAKKHIGGFPDQRPTYVCAEMFGQMPN